MFAKLMTSAAPLKADRRQMLIGLSAIGGGFILGFGARPAAAETAIPPFILPPKADVPPTAYLRVSPDDTITVIVAHLDMGQGIYNGVATLVAEEMDADWTRMRAEGGAGNVAAYGNLAWGGFAQGTGGSTGMSSSFLRYRQAAAAARAILVAAAAKAWGVPAGEIAVADGVLSHGARSARFGEMAEAAAAETAPAGLALKPRARWTRIGNPALRRMDSVEKGNGAQIFTSDLKLDGMLTAVPIHPPMFGAKLKTFDATRAKAVPGVVDVVAHPRGLAVVAEHMWAALKGREAVTAEWDETAAVKRSTADIEAEYRAALAQPAKAVARSEGDVDGAFAAAAKVIEAEFSFPYLAHAALEPMNAAARINADGTVEVWGGHQMPDIYQAVAAQVAGVSPDKVKLHVMKTGGGFGRRAVADADVIVEAVAVAKAVGRPVKMQWTREDDTRGGRYRPAYLHAVKAGIDANGDLAAWRNHIVGQSIMAGTPFAAMVTNGVDPTSVEGGNNIPYAIPNVKVELTTMETGVPVLWWRAVGSTHTAYAVETFLDEVAEAAGKDPVEFRLAMLNDKPRHAAVLRLAAEKAGWGKTAAGRFQGVALAESFNSFVAQVAEISMIDGRMKVERVVCAVDCGIAVTPDQVRSQIEGGIGFGLGAILKSRLTLDGGRVVEGNFDGYEVLTIAEMPEVEVHIVESDAYPTGVGEPGVPPIGPAVANAFHRATGKRIRALPFNRPENA
jgi:isoquinoline 1-oxidoreductase beta subunit